MLRVQIVTFSSGLQVDEWIHMSMDDVRAYEKRLQEETNEKLAMKRSNSSAAIPPTTSTPATPSVTPANLSPSVEEQPICDTSVAESK